MSARPPGCRRSRRRRSGRCPFVLVPIVAEHAPLPSASSVADPSAQLLLAIDRPCQRLHLLRRAVSGSHVAQASRRRPLLGALPPQLGKLVADRLSWSRWCSSGHSFLPGGVVSTNTSHRAGAAGSDLDLPATLAQLLDAPVEHVDRVHPITRHLRRDLDPRPHPVAQVALQAVDQRLALLDHRPVSSRPGQAMALGDRAHGAAGQVLGKQAVLGDIALA